jgi:two-component system, OmpR family, sensor histidine kinase KdpD
MDDASHSPTPDKPPARGWVSVVLLLVAVTLANAALEPYVSITSQAMLYVLAIVIAAYRLDWLQSAVCAVGAVTALNFFFVPPRWTFEVENREHLIALAVMLVVALVISHLASSVRRESVHAALSERRARQLQALATGLANVAGSAEILELGQRALDKAFVGPNVLFLSLDGADLAATEWSSAVQDGLRCCMNESAVLGPGTGRWPGLNAWYLPLGEKKHMFGAACVQPALANDNDGREHAQALIALLAQTVRRVRLSAKVQAAQTEAQRQQLQGTFLAAVSHDLRTPLAAIVGAASSLQTQNEKLSPFERDRLLGSIVSEATYLSTLTENTLQLVRLNSSAQALRRDWESVEEIVGAVLARLRQRDPQRRIKSKVPPGLPLIKADPVLLAQLISNLLDNALTYSEGEIELCVSVHAQSLDMAIKDRGPGIDESEQELIFEPYRRGDQSGPRGAGLGLALCRAIAVAHGGSLIVRRRPGGGSNFMVTLPIDEQPPEQELP